MSRSPAPAHDDRRGVDWQAVRSKEIRRAADDVRALRRTERTDDWRPDWPTDRLAPHDPIGVRPGTHASQYSCEDALADSLSRIAAFDGELMAFVRLDRERAQAVAVEQDLRAQQGTGVGPLHGFTIGVKDVIDTENVVTACGSPILVDRVPARDAAVVARLRAAGAIVVGKTVTTEFATFDPPPTRNPWNWDTRPVAQARAPPPPSPLGWYAGLSERRQPARSYDRLPTAEWSATCPVLDGSAAAAYIRAAGRSIE